MIVIVMITNELITYSWKSRRPIRIYWGFITGGCSGRGVQWMGEVLYSKTIYNLV